MAFLPFQMFWLVFLCAFFIRPTSLFTCFTWLIGSLILKANGEGGGGPFGLSINIPPYFGWMDIIQWWLVDDLQGQYWSAQNSSILVEMLKQKFGQNFEAEVWPILWSWILIILWYNSKAATLVKVNNPRETKLKMSRSHIGNNNFIEKYKTHLKTSIGSSDCATFSCRGLHPNQAAWKD